MAQPAANPGMAAALNQHDRIRRSTELPLFYGRKEKDSITAQNLVDRVNTAAEIAAWDAARKCNELHMILRDKALLWWNTLDDLGVTKNDWDQVREAFLTAYEPRYTAKATCTNFQDLNQRAGETVLDYFLRVQDSCRKLFAAKPDNINNLALAIGANDAVVCGNAKKEGIKDAEKFFKLQLFIAGLRDEIRSKVMEAGEDTLQDTLKVAREAEVIIMDRRRATAVASIEVAATEKINLTEEDFTEEERNLINAIRHKKGFNFRKTGPPKANSTTQCRYCKKMGHFQKECRSRIREKAPMVDAQGKAYTRKLHKIEEEKPLEDNWDRDADVGCISNQTQALNWY